MNHLRDNQPVDINSITKRADTTLCEIYRKSKELNGIDKTLKSNIDIKHLSEHFAFANIKNDCVIIVVTSPAWATKLRYSIPVILDIFHKQLNYENVKTVRFKVKAQTLSESEPITQERYISETTADFLQDFANNCNDSRISTCFSRLSRHTKP